MLERGWSVVAIDAEEEAIRRVRRRVGPELVARLRTNVSLMEDVEIPSADLVWASYSLFFCHPDRFPDLWARIGIALREGGRFAGQVLGDRDTWASLPDRSAFTAREARSLFDDTYVVERFEEEEEDEEDDGESKHWHVFHVVARKAMTPPVAPSGTR